jgi:hypothetical protein
LHNNLPLFKPYFYTDKKEVWFKETEAIRPVWQIAKEPNFYPPGIISDKNRRRSSPYIKIL